MPLFRVRLIVALIASVTLVSLAFTYFDVLAHRHRLREDLERRTKWMGMSVEPDVRRALAAGNLAGLPGLAKLLKEGTGALGLAIYDAHGNLLAGSGPPDVMGALGQGVVEKSLQRGVEAGAFGHAGQWQWLEQTFPIHDGTQLQGAMALVVDAGYIRSEGIDLWQRSFWRIVAFVIVIVGITILMVRWFLLRPMSRAAERLRLLRTGDGQDSTEPELGALRLFSPLAREVETMAASLRAARASAAAEARLREAGANLWTAERLAVHIRNQAGSSKIFVVSNREPYMHVRQGREIVCVVPPSGLVTALEPVLRACDGVWVASGSGDADKSTVDEFDRLRVPPDDPRYTLRRVWLSEQEESQYYEGFSNEGLWPLCHIAHTRPIFRAADWECYQLVNQKFADALLEEMKDSPDPVVFVQDYHLALLPSLIKKERPDARVAIFWHIPWPNPEAFGICPWQAELLDGLLGADLIGFHIPLHCHNFLATVDRVLEARTDRDHMSVIRHGHASRIRSHPISVAFDGAMRPAASWDGETMEEERAAARQQLLSEFGVRAETLAVGVDRLDYTKGIVERLEAIGQLLEDHPWHRERLTMVQIAAPSRTRIPSYAELRRRVEETAARINARYQTVRWKPIVLIERQCNHEEVSHWYRAADICLVTSLHDGMNLVAKEFVAARDDDDGVLVLSRFTGAAVELRDALLINPYDVVGVAEAVHAGLEMSRAERRERMQTMRRQVMEYNIYMWAANILGDLRGLRLEPVEAIAPDRIAPDRIMSDRIASDRVAPSASFEEDVPAEKLA
jgi:alpha,alpha-trehalose-phosphate synthase [UDP-forming]